MSVIDAFGNHGSRAREVDCLEGVLVKGKGKGTGSLTTVVQLTEQ